MSLEGLIAKCYYYTQFICRKINFILKFFISDIIYPEQYKKHSCGEANG